MQKNINMKNKCLINRLTIAFAILLSAGCSSSDVVEIKSGEIKFIPFTSNYAIGTDSTIVIIEKESGKTLNVISRH